MGTGGAATCRQLTDPPGAMGYQPHPSLILQAQPGAFSLTKHNLASSILQPLCITEKIKPEKLYIPLSKTHIRVYRA